MDKAALRELAEKATPGPHHIYTHPRDDNNHAANAEFHSACWPQTILALLDEIQSLTEERTAWRVTAENAEAELKAIKEAEPLFWYRPCGDGLYEGPHHNNSKLGKLMRKEKPDAWAPLYTLQGESK